MKSVTANARRREMRKTYKQADEHYKAGRFEHACALYEVVYNHNVAAKGILLKFGTSLSMTGRLTTAIQILRDAVALNPQCQESATALAHVYFKMSDYATAEQIFLLALTLGEKQSAQIYYFLGLIHKDRNNYGLAQGMFESVLNLDANVLDAYLKLAEIHLYYERPKDARFYLTKALHCCGICREITGLMNECEFRERLMQQESRLSYNNKDGFRNYLLATMPVPSRLM